MVEWAGQNREIYEEYNEHSVKEKFQQTRVKFGRDGKGGREALRMRSCNISTCNELELNLA